MKRTLSILIVAVMLFGLIPSGAIPSFAATSYDLWVGTTEVTSECLSGEGWSYEPLTNTLTLDNFTYSGPGHALEVETRYLYQGFFNAAIAYLGSETFNLAVEGENSLSVTGSNLDCTAGICSLSGVNISGVGSLDVTAGDSLEYCHGIYVDGTLTVSGSTLRFVCGHGGEMSRAVDAYGDLYIMSGEVYAEGGEAGDNISYGIFANGKLEISGGKVTALGGKATMYSAGFLIGDDFFINGGTVFAAGGDADLSCGVMSNNYKKILTVDTGVEYFSSSGNSSAFENLITVKNLVAGTGWDNVAGEGDGEAISVNTEGAQLEYKRVEFKRVVISYDLWIGETQVTSKNCGNIPGVTGQGAKAEYDPDTNTLTLTGVKGVTGTHGDAAIYAENIDLTVKGDASVNSAGTYGIKVCETNDGTCSLTLEGKLSFNSRGTAVSCDGDIVIPDTHYIKTPFGGSVVTEPKRGTSISYIADKDGNAAEQAEVAEKVYYDINVSAGNGGTASAQEHALAGEPITVTIEPDEEYVVSKVTVSYGMFESIVYNRNTGDGSLPVKFTMPDANVTVTVTFSAKVYYGLSSLTVSEGTLDPEFKTKNASYTVDVGCGVDEVEVSFSCTSNRQLLLDESQFKPGSLTYQYNDPYYSQCKTDGVGTVVLTGEETTVKIKVNVINGPFDMVEYTVKITRTAHTLGHTDGVAAKCEETGMEEYWKCSVCGKLFSDKDAKDEISEPQVIGELGHDFTAEVATDEYLVSAATCTEPAVYKKSCTRCRLASEDETFTFGEAAGHDYKAEVTEPTCTEEGFTTYTCTVCGDSYVDDTSSVEPLGHEWDDGVITKQPTADERGVRTYTCLVCGETKTEEIGKLSYKPDPVIPQPEPEPEPEPKPEPKPVEPAPVEPAPTDTGAKQTGDNVATLAFIATLALISGAALVIGKKKLFDK
ncbi:MAG: hypothetical protein IJQ80_04415 [Clostridia bacterium]|nr:hypothetical protein [Clostridia bacterium]